MKYIIDGTANVVMHPARYKILQTLRKTTGPMFVDQISKKIEVHPRMVSHHLDVLEEQGLVECKYDMVQVNGSRRSVAVRLCKITEKTEDVFNDIMEALKEE